MKIAKRLTKKAMCFNCKTNLAVCRFYGKKVCADCYPIVKLKSRQKKNDK